MADVASNVSLCQEIWVHGIQNKKKRGECRRSGKGLKWRTIVCVECVRLLVDICQYLSVGAVVIIISSSAAIVVVVVFIRFLKVLGVRFCWSSFFLYAAKTSFSCRLFSTVFYRRRRFLLKWKNKNEKPSLFLDSIIREKCRKLSVEKWLKSVKRKESPVDYIFKCRLQMDEEIVCLDWSSGSSDPGFFFKYIFRIKNIMHTKKDYGIMIIVFIINTYNHLQWL